MLGHSNLVVLSIASGPVKVPRFFPSALPHTASSSLAC
ncbi:hypothetical protein SLEP1_g9825 [Rubroshorea leprosula]|uniref:Uncharacterized protein n=1 Tax=Rubroshorea leprosula TaxID=152421 RepID=A0AAV5I639_9ROSI|nr:hypothetical protein SLEP1_g9825 [Rubroshorea leprosula]